MAHEYDLRHRVSSSSLLREPTRPALQARASSSASSSHHCGHSHADAEEEAAALLSALRGSADRGSRITLIGLASNIGLTAVKGAAGWWLSSASLVADAAHSLSDLTGDFIVLFCWKLSRRPANTSYPYGYGKFESLGTLAVACFLLLGGSGIGAHSYASFTEAADHTSHHHDTVDPNAAWFALASILVKEWLYRATLRIAEEEKSNVLTASAYHHRSDAYSSIVALLAIAGSWIGFTAADPIGGLVVAVMIAWQGLKVGYASVTELLDQAADPVLALDLKSFILDQRAIDHTHASLPISDVASLRLLKSGALHLADIVLLVSPQFSVREASALEKDLTKRIRTEFPTITEIALRYRPY